MIFFALLAALGLTISTAAHFSTHLGIEPMHRWPWIWLLHLGLFVVFVPAICVSANKRGNKDFTWRAAFRNAPAWMRWMTICIAIYAPLNGAAFGVVGKGGGPYKEPDGTYAMSSHGRILRTLTADEYHRASGYEFRFMSCWWMMFYSVSLTVLVSEINRQKALANGHGAADTQLHRSKFIPIWLHQAILLLCILFGWVGMPMLTAFYILPLVGNYLGHWQILMVAGAWVFGVFVVPTFIRRHVPAGCPICGGRVSCQSVINWTYLCTECGHFEKRTK
jgi:hypothetical protein